MGMNPYLTFLFLSFLNGRYDQLGKIPMDTDVCKGLEHISPHLLNIFIRHLI